MCILTHLKMDRNQLFEVDQKVKTTASSKNKYHTLLTLQLKSNYKMLNILVKMFKSVEKTVSILYGKPAHKEEKLP